MKIFILILFTFFTFSLQAKLNLVASHPNIKYIADQIGQDKIESYSMIRGVDDPHFVMTRPDLIVKLNKADIFCTIGLDLEVGWVPLLLQQSRNIRIQKGQPGYCDTSVGIKVLGEPTIMLDRSMGDMHIYGNPHYWLDPINAVQMAANILAALIRVDPVNGEFYEKNYLSFKQRMVDLVKEEMKKFSPYFGSKVAVFHDQFIYLANRFKFTANLTLEERPGVPPSNRYLEQVINKMKAENTKVILISVYHNPVYAEYVASKVPGSVIITIPEAIGSMENINTYEDTIRVSLKLIREALEKTKGN
jgi:zinc/manganese transport system substrate-binding protein